MKPKDQLTKRIESKSWKEKHYGKTPFLIVNTNMVKRIINKFLKGYKLVKMGDLLTDEDIAKLELKGIINHPELWEKLKSLKNPTKEKGK